MSDEFKGYVHKSHIVAVIRASGSSGEAGRVLLWACIQSDHSKPFVVFTKDQFIETLGMCRNTMIAALRYLRTEGSLVPVRNIEGGKGIATEYRLQIVGRGEELGTPEGNVITLTERDERLRYLSRTQRKNGYPEARRLYQVRYGCFPEDDPVTKR